MDYQQNGSGYGKRPMWQWILLYIVIGGIVYGLIYYFWLGNSGYNYNQTSNTNATVPAQSQQWP